MKPAFVTQTLLLLALQLPACGTEVDTDSLPTDEPSVVTPKPQVPPQAPNPPAAE